MIKQNTKCGYAAIIGKPNVGKSTLLNHLLGEKIAITSHKAQTTRHRILGIKTSNNAQILYLDTPGLHSKEKNLMNRYMNRAAHSVLNDVGVIVWLVEALRWDEEDENILRRLSSIKTPVILAINKVDKIKDKNKLLPYLDGLKNKFSFATMMPISAEKNIQLDVLEKTIVQYLPDSPFCYPEGQITDANDSFVASEIIREKLTRLLGQELPYALTVMIEAFEKEENIIKIAAIILVNKENQKAIVIGKKGAQLKAIGTQARKDLETYFSKKVFLKLWVKVKSNWADNEKLLNSLGHME